MFWITSLLKILAAINLLGMFAAGYMFLNPPVNVHEPGPPFIFLVRN
jgi:hypothetical protein